MSTSGPWTDIPSGEVRLKYVLRLILPSLCGLTLRHSSFIRPSVSGAILFRMGILLNQNPWSFDHREVILLYPAFTLACYRNQPPPSPLYDVSKMPTSNSNLSSVSGAIYFQWRGLMLSE